MVYLCSVCEVLTVLQLLPKNVNVTFDQESYDESAINHNLIDQMLLKYPICIMFRATKSTNSHLFTFQSLKNNGGNSISQPVFRLLHQRSGATLVMHCFWREHPNWM